MPHLATQLLTPQQFNAEGILFPVPLASYPGKPIVIMLPIEERVGELDILIPKEVAEKYAPDFGVVVHFQPRKDSDGRVIFSRDLELKPGMLVAVKPYSGCWYNHKDFPWIPEGRMVKILGSAVDGGGRLVGDWSDDVLAAVEM